MKNKHLVIAAVAVLAAVGLVRAAGDTYLFNAAEAARRQRPGQGPGVLQPLPQSAQATSGFPKPYAGRPSCFPAADH